jgi:hypothetical protein
MFLLIHLLTLIPAYALGPTLRRPAGGHQARPYIFNRSSVYAQGSPLPDGIQ